MFYLNLRLWNLLCSFLFVRLLALATCFATKMIRKYWLLEHRKDAYESGRTQIFSLPPVSPVKVEDEMANSRRLHEMAHFLEIIRNLQCRLGSKYKRPGQELVRFAVLFSYVCMYIYIYNFYREGKKEKYLKMKTTKH